MEKARHLTLPGLASSARTLARLAFSLAGCENVATYTQPTLVRVIDASYVAPHSMSLLKAAIIAGNVGQGTISPYGTLPSTLRPHQDRQCRHGRLAHHHQQSPARRPSVLRLPLRRCGTPSGYTVSVLTDQQISAPTGHSAFRFLNQAIATGPVDVYMIPTGVTLANSKPIVADLPVGASNNYIDFNSQTVTLVVTPAGKATPNYTSPAIYLVGGEVRTVLLVDAQLTSNPPIQAFFANDVN